MMRNTTSKQKCGHKASGFTKIYIKPKDWNYQATLICLFLCKIPLNYHSIRY